MASLGRWSLMSFHKTGQKLDFPDFAICRKLPVRFVSVRRSAGSGSASSVPFPVPVPSFLERANGRAISRPLWRTKANLVGVWGGDSPPSYCGARDGARLGLKTLGPKGSHEHFLHQVGTDWVSEVLDKTLDVVFHALFENEGPRA